MMSGESWSNTLNTLCSVLWEIIENAFSYSSHCSLFRLKKACADFGVELNGAVVGKDLT